WNHSGTAATTPASMTAVLNGGVKISQGLAPDSDRHFLMDSVAMAAVVGSVSAFFHRASEIERAFSEGFIGQAAGFKWWESNMTPTHTNGSRDDTTPVVDTSTGIVSGTATITTTGFDSGKTMKKGDVFTVAEVFAVNEETKQKYSHLQQWTVTADITLDGTDVLAVSPTPVTTGAKQNIVIENAGAGKVLLSEGANTSGAADTTPVQDLAYHRDAFTYVTADLEMPRGVDFAAREVFDGISLRVVRNYDITNDKFPARIDVLYGFKTIRPQWACRVRG
ncbi:MAG: P22 phage major capsid protein family protein, partial [Nitrospiraceae bacterium]